MTKVRRLGVDRRRSSYTVSCLYFHVLDPESVDFSKANSVCQVFLNGSRSSVDDISLDICVGVVKDEKYYRAKGGLFLG